MARGERVVVDEAGMLDQDTALALLAVAAETGATVALVGDRAQLPAVGRGGVLDMAAHIRGRTFDMTGVHRFTNPDYAALTVRMRPGDNPAAIFDQLHGFGLIQLHPDDEAVREHIAAQREAGAAVTVATNDEVRALNERIRARRVQDGQVDDARTVIGSDGLRIGAGDVIQTRRNDRDLRVANRQTWTVQHIADDGTVWVKETGSGGPITGYDGQPRSAPKVTDTLLPEPPNGRNVVWSPTGMRGVPSIRELRRRPTAPVPAEVEALTAGYEGGGPAMGLGCRRIRGTHRTTVPARMSRAGKARGQLTRHRRARAVRAL